MAVHGEHAPTPFSTTAGLTWPALPGARGLRVLALLHQFDESQWWSPEALRRRQFDQLRGLARHAADTVPFWRERFAQAGIETHRAMTPDDLSRLPVLTRAEVQELGEKLFARSLPAGHGRVSTDQTTGSTGTPIKLALSQLNGLFWSAFTVREHLWQRRDLGQVLAVIRGGMEKAGSYPRGGRGAAWGRATGSVYRTGPVVFLDIGTDVGLQAEWLGRQNAGYLLTYPTNLHALLEHTRDSGLRFPTLKQVVVISELLKPEVRDACRDLWGVPVVDIYSAREVGYIALQCPDHEHLHIQSEGVIVEVLDPQGRACGPGETGEVVVTAPHNFAMPLFRYAIGDFAEVGNPCPCGRGLPVLTRVLGRVRGTVHLPSGEQIYPDYHHLLRDLPMVRQFQIVRTGEEDLELRLVVRRELDAAEEGLLAERVRDRFHYPFAVALVYVDEIPRGPGGKFEDFISRV